MSVATGTADPVLLPFRHLQWRSVAVAIGAVSAPVCGVTLLLSLQGGHPVPALVLTGVVLAVVAALWMRIGTVRVVLTADGMRFWTLRRRGGTVPGGTVARAVIRGVHSADGRGVRRHLFLLDRQQRTLFRMCDRWWTDGQLSDVARHFEVPVEALPEPVHLAELRRTVPRQLHWHEQHPWLAWAAGCVAGAAGCTAVGWLAVSAL